MYFAENKWTDYWHSAIQWKNILVGAFPRSFDGEMHAFLDLDFYFKEPCRGSLLYEICTALQGESECCVIILFMHDDIHHRSILRRNCLINFLIFRVFLASFFLALFFLFFLVFFYVVFIVLIIQAVVSLVIVLTIFSIEFRVDVVLRLF